MNGGNIANNTAKDPDDDMSAQVFIAYGTFTMNSGQITGTAGDEPTTLYVMYSKFTMSGGTITGINGEFNPNNDSDVYILATTMVANGGTINARVYFAGSDSDIPTTKKDAAATSTIFQGKIINIAGGVGYYSDITAGNFTGTVQNYRYMGRDLPRVFSAKSIMFTNSKSCNQYFQMMIAALLTIIVSFHQFIG